MSRRAPRRELAFALVRSSVVTAVVLIAYCLLPLDLVTDLPVWVPLAVALAVLATFTGFQLRAVIHARHPGLRAIEALSATLPLFLVLFAISYTVMAGIDPGSFNVDSMTRVDAMYFTVTVFATVGFGDISPVSETARLVVTVQMILDVIVIGLGIRAFVGAVKIGRNRTTEPPPDQATAKFLDEATDID